MTYKKKKYTLLTRAYPLDMRDRQMGPDEWARALLDWVDIAMYILVVAGWLSDEIYIAVSARGARIIPYDVAYGHIRNRACKRTQGVAVVRVRAVEQSRRIRHHI